MGHSLTSPPLPQLQEETQDFEDVLLLTPVAEWNPHNPAHAHNEKNMLDWEGKMIPKEHRVRTLLSDIPDESPDEEEVMVSSVEVEKVDQVHTSTEHLTCTGHISDVDAFTRPWWYLRSPAGAQ